VKTEVAFTGFDRPVQLTHAGDGSGRAFVVELPGVIRLIQDGKVLPKAFLDVSDKVSTGGERGFFSIAFPPDYAASGRFYVDYTNKDGNSVISRYRVSASDSDSADPGSEQVLLAVDQPFSNHNGGQLAFGPDGYLYVGFGDGGSEGDPFRNGQNPNVLLGKILRLDVSGSGGYSVPRDNPFVGRKGYRPEIWDLGLRNPWRFSFDLANGDLYIADVGGTDWEEIDWEPAHSGGRNYGWNIYEGTHPFPPGTPPASAVGLTMPVAEYGHDQGDAVMGAYVYRGRRWPALAGAYFYGDYGSGRLWALTRRSGSWESAVVADTGLTISGFGQDQSGELYLCDLSSGSISRIVGR
jgi:glucose/arabinose dehydrogenase